MRPQKLQGGTTVIETGCGKMYVTVNRHTGKIFEIFATLGRAGGCPHANLEAITRMISICVQAGIEPETIVKQLIGIRCPNLYIVGPVLSCADAVAKVLKAEIEVLETADGSE